MPEFAEIPIKHLGRLILDKERFDYYVSVFRSRGMEGPLSWYRTREINWQEDRALTTKTLPESLPALLIMPSDDVAVPPSMSRTMKKRVPQVELVEVAGSGHWAQNEMPGTVVQTFKEWVERSVLPNEKKGSGMLGWLRSKL